MKYLLILLLYSCGTYQAPLDQCIGKGTKCHGEDTNSQSSNPGDNQSIPGPIGPVGPRGPTGTSGAEGPQGIPGQSCTVEKTSGGATISCPGSEPVEILNGNNGQDGTPGTVIIPIQLCPGTPVYPSVFPEIAICIDNNLYAVYSTNGGFLTKLLPGIYQSNAVGSRCNFTVLSNCVIEQEN